MKTKNLYYHTVFKRSSNIKSNIVQFFLAICSWPRILIENFTRKSMGERYFSFSYSIFLVIVLGVAPFGMAHGESFFTIVGENFSWYAYDVALFIFTIKRAREVKREPGVHDFAKFSLSPGIINPAVRNLGGFGKHLTTRLLATYIEPGIFLIVGIILALLQQKIGTVLIVSSIIYSLSWSAQFHLGDEFILDTIDQMIANEELVDSFVHDREPQHTKGFEVYGDRPTGKDFRRKVADYMVEEEPAVDVL